VRYKAVITSSTFPAFVVACYVSGPVPLQAAPSKVSFDPLSRSSSIHSWSPPSKGIIILTQGSDAFPPLGFDPSHPENSVNKPKRAPVWPVSPAVPDPAKPARTEPMKLMQPPRPAPAPAVQPGQPRSAGNKATRPAYPAPLQPAGVYPGFAQPIAPYGYGYPQQPPGFNWRAPVRNPWAQGNRNSLVRSGKNSWSKAGRNSWSTTGRNNLNTNRQNPWAAPNRDVNRPQYYRGGTPYYGQRQPVYAPRSGNPWDTDASRAANGGYRSQFAPLYRPRDTKTKTRPAARNRAGVYPNYNWPPRTPWYGGPAGIR